MSDDGEPLTKTATDGGGRGRTTLGPPSGPPVEDAPLNLSKLRTLDGIPHCRRHPDRAYDRGQPASARTRVHNSARWQAVRARDRFRAWIGRPCFE